MVGISDALTSQPGSNYIEEETGFEPKVLDSTDSTAELSTASPGELRRSRNKRI